MQQNDPKIEALQQLCRAVVEEAGFDLLLLEWTSNQGRRVLRLYIDHEEAGVNVDDCATVSRRLSHVLDVEEVIESAYALEVSTPGLNRPLVREVDFARFAGELAKVTLKEALPSGRKRLKGELKGADAGEVSIEVDGELYRFAVADVARANLVYQGDFEPQPNLNMVLEQVGKDKGIDRSVLVQTLEQAILTAAKKTFGQHREMEARYNEERGTVDLYLAVEVVDAEPIRGREITVEEALPIDSEAQEGDELLFQIFYSPEDKKQAKEQDEEYGELLDLRTQRQGFGRIAAQTAKQVIIQRVREAEREQVYNEYKDRKGELITGIVRRFERGNIIVDLGRAEAILPVSEQVSRESYRAGDRIVAYVNDIERAARGPQIVLSRTNKRLLEKLFEMEVPEIYEKIVRIESSAREPGSRSKIAVSSSDRDVDPVGACVGMKGSRVQAVVQELRGEKIDIVPYDEDPARFVCNAIAPAEVSRVLIDAETHTMELIVPDDKLSLAIGKKGQNVRLASQLSGWRIDIHSETKVRELEAQVREEIAGIDEVDDDLAETMFKLGWRSAEEVANANVEELASIPGLGGLEAARRIQMNALLAVEREKLRAEIGAPTEEAQLLQLRGVTEDILAQLTQGGYHSVDDLVAEEDWTAMADATGLTSEQITDLQKAARELLELDGGEELTEFAPGDGGEEFTEFAPGNEEVTEFKPDGEEFTEYRPEDSKE